MIRLLFWVAVIFAAVWFYRRWKRREAAKSDARPPAGQEPASVSMVRCAQCGIHLPRDRALPQGEQWYCSTEHRLQGPAARGH